MITKQFVINVEVSDECESATGGITSRHLAAAFNMAKDEDNGDLGPLGQIIWAPEYDDTAVVLDEIGWYIVGVRAIDPYREEQ